MRSLRASFFALLVVVIAALPARAQQLPPLESVTLHGRVLRPDASPLANTAVYVLAVEPNGGGTTRYDGRTDGAGYYSFTFPNAHRHGEQTNTDYHFFASMPSQTYPGYDLRGTYELELQDPDHPAPDLVLWDPSLRVSMSDSDYTVTPTARVGSAFSSHVYFGAHSFMTKGTRVDRQYIEDARAEVAIEAFQDLTAAGTIYHQWLSSGRVAIKGGVVPLSRRAACTATRSDGSTLSCPGFTDGDLSHDGVADPKPCPFGDRNFGDESCQFPIEHVAIDLGSVKEIGRVTAFYDCACNPEVSVDGTTWAKFPDFWGHPAPARFVRISRGSLATVPELSAWAPRPSAAPARTPPRATPPAQAPPTAAPTTTTTTVPATTTTENRYATRVPAPHPPPDRPWPAFVVGLFSLVAAAIPTVARARAEGRFLRRWGAKLG